MNKKIIKKERMDERKEKERKRICVYCVWKGCSEQAFKVDL